MTPVELWRATDTNHLARTAADLFADASQEAVQRRGRFTVALAGGNTPRQAYVALTQEPRRSRIDWSRTYLFWGDERCVPPDHPDSNYRMIRETLIEPIGLPDSQVFRIPTDAAEPEEAARRYEVLLREVFGSSVDDPPRFDLILLGLGEDGHTASLFPETPSVEETPRLVVAVWVEKLNAHRITLTLRVINAARTVAFLVSGSSKATVVERVLDERPPSPKLPAQRVRPTQGTLLWMVDRDAAPDLGRIRPDVVIKDLEF